MNIKDLEDAVGSLSITTKIPAPGFSTSAFDCHVGNKLAKIPGTVCYFCYARHGNNLWADAQKGYRKRSKAIDQPYWADFMVELIKRTEERRKSKYLPTGYFRWFNSGDLKNYKHLEKIVDVCKRTPAIKHWLPTKEHMWVKQFLKIHQKFPRNLCVRLSAINVNEKAPRLFGLPGSGVVWNKKDSNCKAYKGGKKANCGSCRMCWDKKVKEIYYPWHMGKKVGKEVK